MTANDKIKTLYDALSKDYDLGGYADFSQKMTDEGKRRLLFDAISGTYDVGDWDTFNAKLGGVKQPPCHLAVAAQPAAPAATTTAVAAPATPAATPDAPAEDKTDTVAVAAPDAPAAPVAQKPVAPVTPAAPAKPQVDVSLLGPEKAEGPDEAPVPVLSKPERHVTENGWDKPEWGGTELPGGATEAEEKPTDVPLKYGDELLPEPNDYQKALMGARMEGVKERGREIVEEAEKKLANMEEYRSKTHGAGGGIPLKSHTVLGEDFKPVETWITPQGNRYTDKADAELECFNIRNMQADMTTGGQLAHARARLRYMEERYDEVLGKKMEEETMAARPINVSAEILPMDYVTMDSEVQSYHTAVKNLKEQIRKLEHMQEGINKQDSFWDNFGRNFWEKFTDVGVWDGGKSDMMQSNASMIINNKIRRGKKLTEAEESALYEMYLLQGLEGYEGHGAAMGEMAGEMAPYILEFILTGGGFSGLTRFAANATAKVATRSAARMLARGAARAAKDATKSLGMKIATEGLWKTARSGARGMVAQMLAEHGRLGTASILATKGFGTLAEHMLVRSPLMAVTIQNQKLASEIIDTKLGPVEYDEENGELRFSNDKGWGQAAWEAGASRIFENASEMISPELPGVATLAEMFGAKRLAGLLTRATGEGLGGSFGKMRNFFVKKMGLGNVVEEGMEEEYKQLLDTIADLPSAYEDGDMKTKNNFDSARFHIDVWGGMLITMGVPTAAHMTAKGSYGAAEYGARKFNMSRYSNKCEKLFGKDRWAEMRLMFDAAEMDELVDLATHAYTDKTLSEEQRKAVMNYIGSSFKLKGHNLGMRMLQRARTDGSAVRDENGELVGVSARDEHEKKLIGAVRAAYLNGLDSAIDERSMRAAAKMYKNRLAKLAEAMGRSEEEAGRLAEELFEKGNSEGWSKDVVSAAYDYVIAKNVIAGMRQGERDYMAMVESAARDEVEEMTHKGDGMIHPVFMPDPNGLEEDENEVKGTTVYVVSGNLGVTSDGAFVSSSQSDQALMIWNPQTGQTEMTDAKKLSHAMPAMDAAEHLSEITQSRRAEAEQWFERGRRGEVSPAEGMKFVVNGKVLTIARGADGLLQSNNGMVNVSDGKSIFEISIDELQAAYDAELENDIKNWEEAKYGDAANGQNEAAPAPADDKSDPKPVGTGVFGAIYDQFRGKAKSAVEFLRRIKSGEAVGALHHDEIGDISIVWGNEKYGLAHILLKHGEIAEDIQVAISGMRVVQASENRIVLESDTHKAVVSKMLGQEKTPQWLLTAYEKKSASGGSSDIVPEPKGGKQNGTAPLQDNSSAGKGTEESANSNNDEHDVEKPLVVGDEVEFEEDGTMMRGMVVEVSADGVTVDVEGADGMPIPYLVDKGKVKRFREPEDKKNGPNEPPAGAAAGGSAALEDSAESSGGMAIAEQDDLAQSEDIDDNGKPFVVSSDGTTIFGEITKESGLNPAPIKLSTGFNKQDEKGNNIGYGLLHIEAGHGEQIRKAGYNSVEEFVEFVTRNYTEIKISRSRSGNQTYMLLELHDEKHKNTLYVELSRDGAYWNVNSGGIFKNKYTDKNDTVWPVPTVGSNANTDAAEVVDSPTEIAEGETVDRGGDSSHAISAGKGTENFPAGETAPAPTALARVPRDEGGKPKFEEVDAETAWDALEEMMGDSGAAGTWVAGRVKSAQKAVDAAKRALSKQKHDDDPMAYMEARKTLADAVVAAERVLKHWQDVAAAREGKAARIAAEEQRKRKEAAAQDGATPVGTAGAGVRAKWNEAPKQEGHKDVLVLADGTRVTGRYVLVEAGAATSSHDPRNGFAPSEEFPIDENGLTVNDRDYQRDPEAQDMVRQMAGAYDSRALQTPVVVSRDGVVLSGNNRTMSGDLAAQDGTDGAYNDYLREFASKYGFAQEQVEQMQHPRVVFVADEAMPYTAETFARFNGQEMKSQSKVGEAAKMGKVVADDVFGRIVGCVAMFDTAEQFYGNKEQVNEVMKELLAAGVISQAQLPALHTEGVLSAQGRELIENVLVGKSLEGHPDAVKQAVKHASVRRSVFMALAQIAKNRSLAHSYGFADELAEAIMLVGQAKTDNPEAYGPGKRVSHLGKQMRMFEEDGGDGVIRNATILMLADIINSAKPTELRRVVDEYNRMAEGPASGQMDLFTGEVQGREDLLREVLGALGVAVPGTRETNKPNNGQQDEQGQGEQGQGAAEPGREGTGPAADGAQEGDGILARSGERVREIYQGIGLTSEEADELLAKMEASAEEMPQLALTLENWAAQFGESGEVDTPMGRVKIGANQISKLFEKGRSGQFGMIKPTLENPNVVIEVPSSNVDGTEERTTSLLFVKTFLGENGEKVYYFKSVTVKKDNLEVGVSSHFDRKKRINDALKNGKLLYRFDGGAQTEHRPADVSVTTSPMVQGEESSGGKGTAESLDEQKDGVANEAASGNAADATPDGGKRYSMAEDLEVVNTRFNAELEEQISGTQKPGHIYQLGMPGAVLRATGVPALPIELSATRLAEKAAQRNHVFDISDVRGLPEALQHPVAVFAYGDKEKSQNVIVELERDGKKFVVGIHFNQTRRGLEVNDIRGLFNKETAEWMNWINQGKLLYADKEKIQALISKQRTNLAEVDYLDLDSAAKVVEEFENPALEGEKIEQTPSAVVSREADAARVEMEGLLGVGVRLVGRDEIEDETKLGALGWYDTRTGEVCVVAEHVTRAEDMRRVILHEVVGHKGLRGVLGARFGEFCGRVFSDVLGEEDRGRMAEYYWDTRSAAEREALLGKDAAGKRWGELGVMERARMMASDELRAGAADEWLARMAEGGAAKPGMWQRLKTMLKEFLAKLGIGMKLTNGDVRVMLHRSAAALRSGKVSERTAASGLAYMMKRDLEAGVMRNVGEKYWNSGMSKAVNDAKSVDELRESMNGMADGYLAKFAEKRAVLSPKRARAQVATLTAQDGHSMRRAAARAGVEFKADAEQYTEEEIGKMVRPVEDLLTENRREVAGKWREALEGQDAAARYLVARALAKYVKDESEGCPIGYFEQPFRETMARFSASGDPVAFNFYQEYNKSLLDMISEDEDAIVEVVSKDGVSGTWVKMRKASESDDEAMTRAKVSAASQGTSWCTRHADVAGTGAHKVILEDDHDFYVFIPRGSGQAEIAIVPVKEGEQGQLKNNPWYTGIFKRTNASDNSVDTNLYEAINTLAKESKDADLVRTLEWLGYTGMSKEEMAALRAEKERGQREFLAARERITAEDIDEVQRLFGVRLNETSEGLSLHEFNSGVWEQAGEEIRDEFWQKVFESIVEIEADADFWDCNVTSLGNLERIGGDATFRGSQVADLGNLREIGGNATFRGSQVADLGNLREIGGNATFRSNQVTSLGNLETIGGYADFSGSQVTSLGNLETIGGYAYFRDSQVTDLGNLREIGVNAWFSDSQVRSLGNLETIGGSADFRDSQVTDLGNLREIGGNAWFSGSQVRSLGNLREIGGSADFRDSQVTDLVDLREIGGNATFSGSQVTSLGSLETIGWRADFSESQVADLGKLREIGGKATFGYSSDLEAQWKARRGGAQLAVEDREVSEDDRAAGELALELLAGAGVEVSLDAEEMAEALGGGAQMAAKLNRLAGASGAIHSWLKNNKRGKVFTIELPRATQEMVRRAMGKDFDSHNITANGVAHAKNNHGVGGRKVTATSIPLRDEDFELIPYIMTAPDRVEKASTDITGRTSVRFYKNLSNGYVVVAEKEYKDSPQDMETITMWAEKSSTAATNARSLANAPDTLVRNAILSMEDAAKIRQDAERAIARDELTQMMMVYHGSGAEFDAFDHSHMGDGAKNYVIFNEEDAKITNRVQFLKTGRGEVYGFVKHGKIYLDAKLLNGNTPVHEYTHLWDAALRKKNPELWKRGVELMRQSPLWEQVVSSPAYADIVGDEDLVASEVHARLTGAEGETLLKQMMAEAKSGQDGVLSRAEKMSLVHKLRAWVREAWQWVRDTMMPWTAEEASGVTLEDFVRMPVADLVAGKKLAEEAAELADVGVQYSIREKPAPRKTGKGYKVFVVKNGKLYPPKVANPGGAATPVEEWLDADAAPVVGETKTGRQQVKAGGKGTQGGSGTLAYRPGWHLGVVPFAKQFNRKNEETGERELFPSNFVWAEVDYAADTDYSEESYRNGVNKNGKYQHSLAGLKRMPVDGSYRYRTNVDPTTDDWIITGAMRVNRLLTPSEVDEMVRADGRDPQRRQDGALTDADVEKLNEELFGPKGPRGGGARTSTAGEIEAARKVKPFGEYADVKRRYPSAQRAYHEMITDLFANENADKSKYARTYFHVADTPAFMKEIGLGGAEFTIPFKQISSHMGKDADHRMTMDDWHRLPEALANPFLITRYDGKSDRFRIYTKMEVNGKYVVVGVDVKRVNKGKNAPMLEVNSIKTVFAKSNSVGANEEIVCYDENITPEQLSLLDGRNSHRYPTIQELSGGKGSEKSETDNALYRERESFEAGQRLAFTENRDGTYSLEGLPGSYQDPSMAIDVWRASHPEWAAELVQEEEEQKPGKPRTLRPLYVQVSGLWSSFALPSHIKKSARERRSDEAFRVREYRRIMNAIAEMSSELGVEVTVVEDTAMLPARKAGSKGWYDRETGRVYIVMPNCRSVQDARITLAHEVVAHKGLRALLGERFDECMDFAYEHADKEIQARVLEIAQKRGMNRWDAMEEYLAGVAETMKFDNPRWQSWWAKVQQWFREALKAMHFVAPGHELSEADFRYLLQAAHDHLVDNAKVGGVRFARSWEVQHSGSELYREGEGQDAGSGSAEAGAQRPLPLPVRRARNNAAARMYEEVVQGWRYQTDEAMLDSMAGLREAMRAIMGNGKLDMADVAGFENAYLGENALSSANVAEWDVLNRENVDYLLDAVAKLAKNEEEMTALRDYLFAVHGIERNEFMARRAAKEEADEAFKGRQDKLDEMLRALTEDADDYDEKMAALTQEQEKLDEERAEMEETLYEEHRKRDYSGLTTLFRTDEEVAKGKKPSVEEAEERAKEYYEAYEKQHGASNTRYLWARMSALSHAILDKQVECGMMSAKKCEEIKGMFAHYVPLRGFDEKTTEDVYAYLPGDSHVYQKPIAVMKGRKSVADDPISNLMQMAMSGIIQGNRNKMVKQRFLNFVLNHPSNLASVSSLWLEYDEANKQWKPIFPDGIDEHESPEVVEQKMQEWDETMKALAKEHPGRYKSGRDAIAIPYRVKDKWQEQQHQIVVRRGGVPYVITINGNPRAAQAVNGLTNPDSDASGSMEVMMNEVGKVNRWLSQMFTTWRPDFVVSNFLRDAMFANTIVKPKEGKNYARAYHRNFGTSMRRIHSLLKRYEDGDLREEDGPLEKAFIEFMRGGGETGYTNMKTLEEHKADVMKRIKSRTGNRRVLDACEQLGEAYTGLSRAVENTARFAAYLTSRQMGRSVARAVYDAKEISVNFNKKGAGGKFVGANGQTWRGNVAGFVSGWARVLYVFWNAGLQGTFRNFGGVLRKAPGATLGVAATYFAWGLMQNLLLSLFGAGGGDDDDELRGEYADLPTHVRRDNAIVGRGKSYISYPLPIEYRAFFGLGELIGDLMTSKRPRDIDEVGLEVAAQFTQLLPVDMMEGGAGWRNLVPSAVKPVVEAWTNTSWTGRPIYRETPYNMEMPDWTKAYKSANSALVGGAKWLNEVTGGDDVKSGYVDLNPAVAEHLVYGYFSGPMSLIDQSVKTAETLAGARDFESRNIPILNRVWKQVDERSRGRAVNEAYEKMRKESEETRQREKGYEKRADEGLLEYAEKLNWLQNSDEYEEYLIFDDYRKEVEALYRELKDVAGDKEAEKEISDEIARLKKEAVEAVWEIKRMKE